MNNQTSQPNPEQMQEALEITKALAYTENGGVPTNPKAGKTGEMKSIFQYEPATWKSYAKEYLGDENAPITPENETAVTVKKVSSWLDRGLTPQQIASSWNAGPGEPNAYTGKFSDGSSAKGINKKYGVAYDVPGYVKTFDKYLSQFAGSAASANSPSPLPTETSQSTPETSPEIASENPAPALNPPVKKGLLPAKGQQIKPNKGLLPVS